jgi:hypothetical protein
MVGSLGFRTANRSAAVGVALIVVAGVAMSCSNVPETPATRHPDNTPATESERGWKADPRTELLTGTIYLLAGESTSHLGVYRLQAPYDELQAMGSESAVSSVAACPNFAAVAAPDPYADHIMRLTEDDLESFQRIGKPRGSAPTLSRSCRLAFMEPIEREGTEAVKVRTWRPGSSTIRTMHTYREAGTLLAWGSERRLAISRSQFPPYVIDIRNERRRLRSVRVGRGIRQLNGLLWGPGNALVATQTQPGRIIIIDIETGARRRFDDWEALAWRPDGRVLLVAQGSRLAILNPRTGRVRVVGEISVGPVYDAAWTF